MTITRQKPSVTRGAHAEPGNCSSGRKAKPPEYIRGAGRVWVVQPEIVALGNNTNSDLVELEYQLIKVPNLVKVQLYTIKALQSI